MCVQTHSLPLRRHAANYQGRGSFISNEQQSLYQDRNNPAWRASLGDIQASFCTPSQTLVASMTAMQLLHTDRQSATIWLARGAPRRWYSAPSAGAAAAEIKSTAKLFGVENGPSRWGTVSFSVGPQIDGVTAVRVTVEFGFPVGVVVHAPTLNVRVRDPTGAKALRTATVSAATDDCQVVAVQAERELVSVAPSAAARTKRTMRSCTILVKFE